MTLDQAQQYLYGITSGDPVAHHDFDPMDSDGGPFQALAIRFSSTPDEATDGPVRDTQSGAGVLAPDAPVMPSTGRTAVPVDA